MESGEWKRSPGFFVASSRREEAELQEVHEGVFVFAVVVLEARLADVQVGVLAAVVMVLSVPGALQDAPKRLDGVGVALGIRTATGNSISRAEIIRALIDALEISKVDLTKVPSEAEMKAILVEQLKED